MEIVLSLVLGLIAGTVLELTYKSWEQKQLVWPKFLNVQMYGLSAVFLYFLSLASFPVWAEILSAIAFTTGTELITGVIYLKMTGKRLWDYSGQVWNYRGLICPEFSVYWAVISLGYYYLILPRLFGS